MDPIPDPVRSSRPYQIGLTIAIILFLLTLTAGITIIIIANARDERREDEFTLTLTSVFADLNQTQTASTPAAAPPVVLGEYAFTAAPVYSEAETCDNQTVSGLVLDLNSEPIDRYTVLVWGDNTPSQSVLTGEISGQENGRWSLPLSGMIHRRVWVQLLAEGRYFSAPIEVIFTEGDCTHNHAEIVFEQVTPLE